MRVRRRSREASKQQANWNPFCVCEYVYRQQTNKHQEAGSSVVDGMEKRKKDYKEEGSGKRRGEEGERKSLYAGDRDCLSMAAGLGCYSTTESWEGGQCPNWLWLLGGQAGKSECAEGRWR